jgi:CDGSH-type Zn-finger protein
MATKGSLKNEQLKEKKIKVSKNGPYLVSGSVPLVQQEIGTNTEGDSCEWKTIKEYPLQENYALCRCGKSGRRPFCDGTHLRVSYDGTENASHKPYLDQASEVNGPALKLTDAEVFCASARFCHRASGIWKLVPQSDDPTAKSIAIEEAGNCPSGTLVVWDTVTDKAIEHEYQQSIVLVEDPQKGVSGPIWVRGGIPIESAEGSTYEVRNRVTLCRCGKSTNKPFCDSSHYPE